MDIVGNSSIWAYLDDRQGCRNATNDEIRVGPGHRVKSYLELVQKVAELQFLNRDYVLLYRGQNRDFRNAKNASTLLASLFRPVNGHRPNAGDLVSRFNRLESAEQVLLQAYRTQGLPGLERIERYKILRWSILQHYEIYSTPLLDVTQSLRIAASVASDGATSSAYVFVIGVPNLSGAITASAEAGLQIVRLSSVCPPSAMRPHIQEGYLIGQYPEISAYGQKSLYGFSEIDVGRRLVGKFKFNPKTFWTDDNFRRIDRPALYPAEAHDPLAQLASRIRNVIQPDC